MNILVVHRIQVFADALAEHLRAAPEVAHVGVAYGADQCLPELGRQRYDIVLLTRAGMERCVRLRRALGERQYSRTRIVVAAGSFNPGLIVEAERARMHAVVYLNQPVETLAVELSEVVVGTRGLGTAPAHPALTPGFDWGDAPSIEYHDDVDIQIVRLLATGLCDKDIAARVFLSSQTVRNRVSRILRDSALENRTQLTAVYLRHELTTMLG